MLDIKSQFNARLTDECIAEIKRVAEAQGLSQAEVVQLWAVQSAGKVPEPAKILPEVLHPVGNLALARVGRAPLLKPGQKK